MPKKAMKLGSSIAVCLGSGINKDGSASESTTARATACAELAEKNPDMTVILSGDGKNDINKSTRTEAELMAEILEKKGIAQDRLLLEGESRDTVGNAILVAARYLLEVEPRRLYVVTSPFHMKRALIAMRGVLPEGWEILPYESGKASDDDQRGANEAGGITWMTKFFEGLTPGDMKAVVKRLYEVGKPLYRDLERLKPFADDNSVGNADITVAPATLTTQAPPAA